MKKKILAITAISILTMSLFTGCLEQTATSDEKAQSQQETMLKQAGDAIGMPNITNFQEKKLMKQIMEQCDKSDLVCYVYTYSPMTGKYSYDGKCIGFGLPYGTEYTNPQKIEHPYSGIYNTLPQADPNGLFKPADVNATWLCMVDETTGEKYIRYAEPDMVVQTHKMPRRRVNEDSLPANY